MVSLITIITIFTLYYVIFYYAISYHIAIRHYYLLRHFHATFHYYCCHVHYFIIFITLSPIRFIFLLRLIIAFFCFTHGCLLPRLLRLAYHHYYYAILRHTLLLRLLISLPPWRRDAACRSLRPASHCCVIIRGWPATPLLPHEITVITSHCLYWIFAFIDYCRGLPANTAASSPPRHITIGHWILAFIVTISSLPVILRHWVMGYHWYRLPGHFHYFSSSKTMSFGLTSLPPSCPPAYAHYATPLRRFLILHNVTLADIKYRLGFVIAWGYFNNITGHFFACHFHGRFIVDCPLAPYFHLLSLLSFHVINNVIFVIDWPGHYYFATIFQVKCGSHAASSLSGFHAWLWAPLGRFFVGIFSLVIATPRLLGFHWYCHCPLAGHWWPQSRWPRHYRLHCHQRPGRHASMATPLAKAACSILAVDNLPFFRPSFATGLSRIGLPENISGQCHHH